MLHKVKRHEDVANQRQADDRNISKTQPFDSQVADNF